MAFNLTHEKKLRVYKIYNFNIFDNHKKNKMIYL